MASTFHRLRRTVSLSSYLLHNSLHRPQPLPSHPNLFRTISAATTTAVSTAEFPQLARTFTSTTVLFQPDERKPFNPETDEIGPDTILFEGCDYNHWLITVDFPKDTELTREQKIEFYVSIAAQVFGSVEEAKKKIYSVSTTTYEGFQVECSEETSNKFQNIPGVVFVLPDSYIDPVNKEYGGDKYVNGEIFPRPPPIHFRRNNRERRPRNSEARSYGLNYGPLPQQQNYSPPQQQQNYGPPPQQQNYGPPSQQQQNYGPPPQQQNYGPPPQQQNYGPPPHQQGYGPPHHQQGYGPPHQQQGYGPPHHQQGYAPPHHQQGRGPPPQQGYAPPLQQQNYGLPPPQQNYGQPPNFPPRQNYTPSGPGDRGGSVPTRINDGQNQPKQGEEPRNFSYGASN